MSARNLQVGIDKLRSFLELYSIISKVNGISGFLSEIDISVLFIFAKYGTGVGQIVEIGSFMGKSAVCMALGLRDRGDAEKVYAIDPHLGSIEHQKGQPFENTMPKSGTTKDIFFANIEKYKVKDLIEPLIMTSEEAEKNWDKSKNIRLLFIDGSHEYEDVLKDYELWAPKIVKNGIIVMHDIVTHSGAGKVFKEKLFDEKIYYKPTVLGNIGFTIKR